MFPHWCVGSWLKVCLLLLWLGRKLRCTMRKFIEPLSYCLIWLCTLPNAELLPILSQKLIKLELSTNHGGTFSEEVRFVAAWLSGRLLA